MEIVFLGTGSAYPMESRGASCIILKHCKVADPQCNIYSILSFWFDYSWRVVDVWLWWRFSDSSSKVQQCSTREDLQSVHHTLARRSCKFCRWMSKFSAHCIRKFLQYASITTPVRSSCMVFLVSWARLTKLWTQNHKNENVSTFTDRAVWERTWEPSCISPSRTSASSLPCTSSFQPRSNAPRTGRYSCLYMETKQCMPSR